MSHGLLGNRYRLTSRIAIGGMGEVWRATDDLLHREVAVKLLRAHVAADPAFRDRFRTEARITAGLADSGIAQVFDYGEENDLAYLVMELVPGEPLSAVLARNGRLSAEVTLDVISQASRGLQAAHQAGVIHRDIKPGNLLVTRTGLIKITDFGIARALESASVTQTGTVLGTAQYVSPEQASGHPLTPSTDLYSLGVVAYECLTGRPPFLAETQVAVALLHLNEQPPPLPDHVPAAVRALVMALLAKNPAQRPGSARELGDRAMVLRDALAGPQEAPLSTLTGPNVVITNRVGAPPSGGPLSTKRIDGPAPQRAADDRPRGRDRRRGGGGRIRGDSIHTDFDRAGDGDRHIVGRWWSGDHRAGRPAEADLTHAPGAGHAPTALGAVGPAYSHAVGYRCQDGDPDPEPRAVAEDHDDSHPDPDAE